MNAQTQEPLGMNNSKALSEVARQEHREWLKKNKLTETPTWGKSHESRD